MARPRNKERRSWAPNLYQSGNGSYYYLRPDKRKGEEGRIEQMGTDFHTANEAAKILNQTLTPITQSVEALVSRIQGGRNDDHPLSVVIDIIETNWRTRVEETKLHGKFAKLPLAPITLKNYLNISARIREEFSQKLPRTITVRDCARFLDLMPDMMRKRVRLIFGEIFKIAMAKGLCEHNPVLATLEIKGIKKKRKRLTLEALKLIRARAIQNGTSWYAYLLDYALQSGQREGDIVKTPRKPFITNSQGIEGIQVRQRKGRNNKGGSNVFMEASTALKETVRNAQSSPVISDWLFHYPTYTGRNTRWRVLTGKQLPEHLVSRYFKELRNQIIADGYKFMTVGANDVEREMERDELPTFHEIRALTAHLARKTSGKGAATNLLGHMDEDTTDIYLEGHEVEETWMPATALNINIAS